MTRRAASTACQRLRIVGLVLPAAGRRGRAALLLPAAPPSNQELRANLPQLDGSITVYGLAAKVTVQRDARGIPYIRANSLDDLVFAQGFVTAQDRLWQMDLLRRHAAGELAAILGRTALAHDRLQRTLQLRTAADNAYAALPPDQKHWLEVYARGVNASIRAQYSHLPVEFRLLGFKPEPWSPRDSVLVELAMFQDLTTAFPDKLGREALATHLSPDLIADLYPTGSWRDHPPGQPIPDLTAPQPEIKDVPLDESQTKLRQPERPAPPPRPLPLRAGADERSLCSTRPVQSASPDRMAGLSPARARLPASRCSRTTCILRSAFPDFGTKPIWTPLDQPCRPSSTAPV